MFGNSENCVVHLVKSLDALKVDAMHDDAKKIKTTSKLI